MTETFKLALVWILGAAAALVVGLAPLSAAFADGHYLPVSPDSFYHARRILGAVADPLSFFQFDPHMHVPEGSLVTWPWLYDWTMSLIVRAGMALHLAHDPMTLLAHIPVAMFVLAPTLMIVICRQLGLSPLATAVAVLATVLLPANQALYGIGHIGHHYAEHLFVLASLACALGWLRKPDSRARALATGLVLGAAPGVHTAEFILQVPLVLTLAALWIRSMPRPPSATWFALALLCATLAVALPSLPLRLGRFEVYTLSWFQVYCSACTAGLVLFLCRLRFSARNLAIFTGLVALMLIPAVGQIMFAERFLTSSVTGMNEIAEVQSPLKMLLHPHGFADTSSYYTYLLCLVPIVVIVCLWRLWRETQPYRLYFWIACLFGLGLLVEQLRLHYYGSFALYLPWILIWDEYARKVDRSAPTGAVPSHPRHALIMVCLCGLIAVAYTPGVAHRLFRAGYLAGDAYYQVTRQIYAAFADSCRQDSGPALANTFDGHYVLYHTNCSVISNPFMVTPQHERKVLETRRLLSLPAANLIQSAPYLRYVFVRRTNLFYEAADGSVVLMPEGNPRDPDLPLVEELLKSNAADLPPHFRLVKELAFPGFAGRPYARLFALDRPQ